MSARAISWLINQYRCVLDRMRLRAFLEANPLLHLARAATAAAAGRSIFEPLEQRCLLATSIGQPSWEQAGPGPITDGGNEVVQLNHPVSGATQAIAQHPTNVNVMFIGTTNGGVWRSTDADAPSPIWFPLTDRERSLSIGSLALSPFDADGGALTSSTPVNKMVVYAGLARRSSGGWDGGIRMGILKSRNGGASWDRLGVKTFWGLDILSIVPGTQNSNLVLVAAGSDGSTRTGVYRSENGGLQFKRVLDGNATDVVGDPGDPNRFYAAIQGKGVYRSTDGGKSWTSVTGNMPDLEDDDIDNDADGETDEGDEDAVGALRIKLAVHNSTNGNVVYAALISKPGVTHLRDPLSNRRDRLMGIFRSENQGDTWQRMGNAPNISSGGQGDKHFSMLPDRTNKNVLFIAGDSSSTAWIQRGDLAQPVATMWTSVVRASAGNTRPHGDSRAMVFNPAGDIIEADDGGLYRLKNPNADPSGGARQWEALNTNLLTVEVNSVGYDSLNDRFVVGTQDNGAARQPGGGTALSWPQILGGDGGIVQIASTATSSIHYTSTQLLNNFRRQTFDASGSLTKTEPVKLEIKGTGTGAAKRTLLGPGMRNGRFDDLIQFYQPYVLNANDPNRMLIGTNFLYESVNGGDELTVVGGLDDLTNDGSDDDGDGKLDPDPDEWNQATDLGKVTAMAYGGNSRTTGANDDVIYVAFKDLLMVRQGPPVSNTVTMPDFDAKNLYRTAMKGGTIRDIALDPTEWRRGFVIDNKGNIFRFQNTGTNAGDWKRVNGNLKAADFRSVVAVENPDPNKEAVVVVAGRDGVFASFNASAGNNAVWTRVGQRLPNAVIRDMGYDATDDVLYVGTYGRGVWKIPTFRDWLLNVPAGAPLSLATQPPPEAGELQIVGDDNGTANDVIRLVADADDPSQINVFINNAGEVPDLTVDADAVRKISVYGLEGDDTLQIDHANGLISPADGISFDETGPGANDRQNLNLTPIPQGAIDAIRDGLLGLAEWADRLAEFGQIVQDIPGIGANLADTLGIGGALRGGLAGCVISYLQNDVTPTVQELTHTLQTLSATTGDTALALDPKSLLGGVFGTAGGGQELRFDMALALAAQRKGINLNFGAEADSLGLSLGANAVVDLSANFDLVFSFGFDLNPALAAADAFFVRIDDLSVSGRVLAGIADIRTPDRPVEDRLIGAEPSGSGLNFNLNIGFLDAQIRGGSLDLNAKLAAEFTNPDDDPAGNITLRELTDTPVGDLIDLTPTGTLAATLPTSVKLAGYTAISPTIKVTSEDLFGQVPDIQIQDLGDLANFKDLSFQNILNMLQAALGYLQSLEQFDFLDEKLPLIDRSVGDVLDAADAFSQRLEELRNNPATSLQAVEAQIEQFFGITDPTLVELTADGGQTLKIKLNFGTDFDEQLPLDFALTDLPGMPEELASIISLTGSGSLRVTGGASLGLAIGLDLTDLAQPAAFLYGDETTTSLFAKVETDTPIDFTLSIFGLGAAINDATFALHKMGDDTKPAAFTVALEDGGDGRIYFSELATLSTSDVLVSLDGEANLNMPFEFPPGTPIDDPLDVTVPDLAALLRGDPDPVIVNSYPDFNAVLANLDLSGDLSSLLNGLSQLLSLLQAGMNNGAFARNVPLIGDKLDDAANVIERFRTDLLAEIQPFIDDPTGKTLPMVRSRLAEALGPAGLNVLADGPDAGTEVNATDVGLFLDSLTNPQEFRFDLNLQRTTNRSLGFDFDLGLPALGLSMNADVNFAVEAGFKLKTGFGFLKGTGAYLRVQEPNELEVDVNVTMPGLAARGRLGFLQLDVTDDNSFFDANFRFDLTSNDGRLTVAELTNSTFNAKLDGGAKADVNLKLALSYDAQANFPRLFADLNLDWAFGNADTGGSGNFGAAPQVAFNNVKLDLGSFLSRFAGPVLDSINRALEPVQPVVDFLNKELPLLWKVKSVRNYFNLNGDKKITVSEVIQKLDPNAVLSFVEGVTAFGELLQAARDASVGANTLINLGSFNLNNVDLRAHQNLDNVPLTNFTELDTLGQLDDYAAGFATALDDDRLGTAGSAGGGGLSFPILQSPRDVFKLLMGKDLDLFLWDMPKFSADMEISKSFPVLGPISIGFGGRVGIEADLTFGYDTSGLRKLANGGSAADVFDGFFILDKPAGATDDPAEIRAFGEIFIEASVDAILVSGAVRGSLLGTLDLNLDDPDNSDGAYKVRFDEMAEQLNKGLLCLFDITGELSAVLSGRIKVGVGPLSKSFEASFPKIQLLEFSRSCVEEPPPVPQDPVLGANVGGELRLNIGPRAALRLNGGDLTDNDESFYVSGDSSGTVFVTAYGYTQSFTGVVRIRAEGGLGNDTIEIADGVNQPALLYGDFASPTRAGEFGNDQLTGGEIASTLWGGGGDDFLRGRAGRDELSGQDGNDTLYGGDGRDSLEGGQGQDALAGEAGDDQLFGGAGNDLLEGGDGADILGGEAGDDLLVGDDEAEGDSGGPTNDSLFGGDGNDELQGVFGNDSLVGNAGNDLIAGEDGNDTAQGGTGNDQIYGGDGNDSLQGNAGDDALVGEAGGDTITGDDGNDVILGDRGVLRYDLDADKTTLDLAEPLDPAVGAADSLSGGNGEDVIVGQAGGDTIGGGAGNDVVIGDNAAIRRAGAVVLANDLRRRFALSDGGALYNADGTLRVAAPAVGDTFADPLGVPHWAVTLSDHAAATPNDGRYGADTMTGDAGNDVMFGHLGNDTIDAGAGDDYVEGNGGDDSVRGGLGQDVLVGGSSGRFGLDTAAKRPDGADRIFGGDGTMIGQEAAGDTTANGHALDADFILGDNADAYVVVLDLATGAFARFNYDNYGTLKIIPRVAQRLDDAPGTNGTGPGAGDLLHGEDGDDSIWGQAGGDAIFGGGNDDDLIGGNGHDWISGGAGEDAILGDDGYLKTSRNGTAEPLYGIAATSQESIRTPGGIQSAVINVPGKLKKSAVLAAFDAGGDDIAYGGRGNDSLHGGAGDDALSGAEAAAAFYARALAFADQPINPGNVLGFGANKPGEFAQYDEYEPRKKIAGHLLNFTASEADGDDALFGDGGNDWATGGTGADNVYGGLGDDLLNLDDELDTNGGLNDAPDGGAFGVTDRAFGGGGRDVLIANSENDRLIDWAGEFNSYIVPFSQFGPRTISRTLQPQLAEFLLKLAAADGLDTTRTDPNDPARLGEPDGELGIVLPRDADWRGQTGAPDDPQPGNIPGGKRDTLDSVNFETAQSVTRFAPDSGAWSVQSGGYVADYGGDTISLLFLDRELPAYFEFQGTARINKAKAGQKANGFLLFDYRGATDFKFAGINDANDQVVIGQRTAAGWQVLKWGNMKLSADTTYLLKLAVNGTTATLLVNNAVQLSHAFDRRLDDGMIGLGVDNSRTRFDNVEVLVLPPVTAWSLRETFDGGGNGGFATVLGSAGVSGGVLRADATGGDAAIAVRNFGASANSLLAFSAGVQVSAGGFGGLVFDYYSPTDFKYVAYDAATHRLVIGHRNARGWFTDASYDLGTRALGRLGLSIRGTTVSVLSDDDALFGYVYNAALADGGVGVFARDGSALFDDLLAYGDDLNVVT